jgi:RNA polymerase sigma-70 factor (ECF subfamily)
VTERTDPELLRASGDDPDAFRVLYQRWSEDLLRFIHRRSGDHQASLDLLAETFAIAYTRRHRYREERGAVISWLYGIAWREFQRYQRRQRSELRATRRLGLRIPAVNDESVERIDEIMDADRFRSQLHSALGELSAKERDAVRLRVIEQLDYRTVAARLACSEPAARVRVHRALSRLRMRMELV